MEVGVAPGGGGGDDDAAAVAGEEIWPRVKDTKLSLWL